METAAVPPSERSGTTFVIVVLQHRGVFHQQATHIGGILGQFLAHLLKKKRLPRVEKLENACHHTEEVIDTFQFWYPGYQSSKSINILTKWQKITRYPRVPTTTTL